jgi:hypothetical protein
MKQWAQVNAIVGDKRVADPQGIKYLPCFLIIIPRSDLIG